MDSVRVCVKCGDGQVNDVIGTHRRPIHYQNEGWPMKTASGSITHHDPDEWLDRTCTRCGYVWQEAVLS